MLIYKSEKDKEISSQPVADQRDTEHPDHTHPHPGDDSDQDHPHPHPHADEHDSNEAHNHSHPHPHNNDKTIHHHDDNDHEHDVHGNDIPDEKSQASETGKNHGYIHGVVDPGLISTQRGIWAVKWSFIGLGITAIIQVGVVMMTGSVALLADTIHNIGDATTAIPLWIAFALGTRKPSKRFRYGLGRVEDLAGLIIVLTILFSAIVAGWQAIDRFIHPQTVIRLWALIGASIIGFIGNEAVALFRIRVGKEIKSAALIADGYHARVDGLTSLAVLFGALGIWLGFPIADPIVGLLITLTILKIVWDSSKAVFTRMLDGIDPKIINEIDHAVTHINGVERATDIRARWLGHRLRAEISIAVDSTISITQAHAIGLEVRHELMHHLTYLSDVVVHVDPFDQSGDEFHIINSHTHDGLPVHAH